MRKPDSLQVAAVPPSIADAVLTVRDMVYIVAAIMTLGGAAAVLYSRLIRVEDAVARLELKIDTALARMARGP